MHAWVWWIVAAVVLGVVEVTTLTLVAGMLAIGAIAGGLTAAAGAGPVWQVLAFIAVSVALLGPARPIARRHISQPPAIRTGVAALVGANALVLERVDATTGRVKIAGEVWSARCFDEDSVFEPGASVDVVEIDGATAIVI